MTRYVTMITAPFLNPAVEDKLHNFSSLLLKWNQSINLSAAQSTHEVDEHIRDSLHVLPHLGSASRVLDVGAGGGFPAIVIAICLPSVGVTAIEPVRKKHAFLRTAARELDLVNFEALAIRIEDHDIRDYDVATSRATFDLRDWLELGLQFVRPGGLVIGFEAVQRTDLPDSIQRHPYDFDGKSRSIVILHAP